MEREEAGSRWADRCLDSKQPAVCVWLHLHRILVDITRRISGNCGFESIHCEEIFFPACGKTKHSNAHPTLTNQNTVHGKKKKKNSGKR
jgi:hypothetical protein